MQNEQLYAKSTAYLHSLCVEIPNRSVASPGNRAATDFFEKTLSSLGWKPEIQEFDAVDWEEGGASLRAGAESFAVQAGPYSLGCAAEGELVSIASVAELEQTGIQGKIVLLHGEIAKEQLMPKRFEFYNPPEHRHIIALLEQGQPCAVIAATGRNAALAGGVYPFPLIEDGDFDIPFVYMTDKEGRRLIKFAGETVVLESKSRRIPGKSCNVVASQGTPTSGRLVITAHIDTKKGTPGAIDNASGVVVLLLLAELLQDYNGSKLIELVAFNGEEYYSVPGQMLYIGLNQDHLNEILLNINIDGAGYRVGKTAFSFYGVPEELENRIKAVICPYGGITEGVQWVQGDHSIFIQKGRPAVAVSSDWFTDHIDKQGITHTPKDQFAIVDCHKLVEIAQVLNQIVRQ